jgi:hypothetical protein
MKAITLLIGSVLSISLAGCASTPPRNIQDRLLDLGLELGESNQRIPRYRINGWSAIDDRNLVVTAGVNDKYLVELSTPCLGLAGAFFVGFTTPSFGLDRFDNIVVRGVDRRLERCPIEDITRLYPIDG